MDKLTKCFNDASENADEFLKENNIDPKEVYAKGNEIAKEMLSERTFVFNTEWVLLVDIDFFGRIICAGTIFRQVNEDYYQPIINGSRCPSYQIDFMIVKNNPKVFLKIIK